VHDTILTEENFARIERVAACYREPKRVRQRLYRLTRLQLYFLTEERVCQEEHAAELRKQPLDGGVPSSLSADFDLFLVRFEDVFYPDAVFSTHPGGRVDLARQSDADYHGYAE